MQILMADDYEEMSRRAADLFEERVSGHPASVVLATGDTPMGMYRLVAERTRQGRLDVSRLTVFQLDGYLGLSLDDPRSLEAWCIRSALEPWGIPMNRFVRLPEDAVNPEAACRQYEATVESAGGLDVAVLGLGPNGHLGFNEPPSSADAPTRIVELTPESVASNARYWGGADKVPRYSITAGMNVLMQARHVLLLASGERKRAILRKVLNGPVTNEVPASHLQRHPSVIILADRAAWPEEGRSSL